LDRLALGAILSATTLPIGIQTLALVNGVHALAKLQARIDARRGLDPGEKDMPANPEQVEALLNKAQSLLDGLRSTWLRGDIEGMTDDAEAMQATMRQLIDEVTRDR
jgi:hypothetical protein